MDRKDTHMLLTPAQRLKKVLEKAIEEYELQATTDEKPNGQLDIADLRALSAEMQDHIGRNDSARSQSAKSTSESFVS